MTRAPVPGTPDPIAVMIAADRLSRSLGIEVSGHGDGRATARMTVTEQMLNGHGIAHGGVVFSLADTAFACACNSTGRRSVAADAHIVFIAPARLGDRLTADAVLRTPFGRNGIYDVTVRCGDRVIAEFRGRSHRAADDGASGPVAPGDPHPGPGRAARPPA